MSLLLKVTTSSAGDIICRCVTVYMMNTIIHIPVIKV